MKPIRITPSTIKHKTKRQYTAFQAAMVRHATKQEVFLNLQSRSATPTLFSDKSIDLNLPWSLPTIEQEALLNQQSTSVIPTPISNRSIDLSMLWSSTALVEWSGTCINNSYIMRIANYENFITLLMQAMQHAMISYMSSQNKQDLSFIQD